MENTNEYIDIVFENRNKEYGAYILRKRYGKNVRFGLFGMMIIVGLLFIINFGIKHSAKKVSLYISDTITLQAIDVHKDPPPPPLPPQPKIQPKIEIIKFTPPKIVKDEEVKKEEISENENLDSVKIGKINQIGIKNDDAPIQALSDTGKGIIEAPKKKDEGDYDKTFTKVEIESEFPGGKQAWLRFLNKNLHYPDIAISNQIQGTVVIQFIVDKDGNISDIQAIEGPEEGGLKEVVNGHQPFKMVDR